MLLEDWFYNLDFSRFGTHTEVNSILGCLIDVWTISVDNRWRISLFLLFFYPDLISPIFSHGSLPLFSPPFASLFPIFFFCNNSLLINENCSDNSVLSLSLTPLHPFQRFYSIFPILLIRVLPILFVGTVSLSPVSGRGVMIVSIWDIWSLPGRLMQCQESVLTRINGAHLQSFRMTGLEFRFLMQQTGWANRNGI